MGSVWVAKHLHLDAFVAVKFMSPEYAASADARLRFEREAKASAQIKSPHVVQVHDFGVEEGTPFLAMELLDGEDLGSRLKQEGRLSLTATAAIASQACKGLRRAHETRIIHRDLKPGNLFLQRQDDEEIVKILDFGLAKVISPTPTGDETKTGLLMGSLRYMSPEQVQSSKHVDHRSDLWSMGVILFRCLTGRLPFDAEEMCDVFIQILRDPIPAPSSIAPELNPEVDRFFQRALERDRDRRFQSARELAEAFCAIGGFRISAEWKEPAPARLERTPSASSPRTKSTLSDQTTAVRGAPLAVTPALDACAPEPDFKISPSILPTTVRKGRADLALEPGPAVATAGADPHAIPGSPNARTSDFAAVGHALSLDDTLTSTTSTASTRSSLRHRRKKGAVILAVAGGVVGAVIAGSALFGARSIEPSEVASAARPSIDGTAEPRPAATLAPSILPVVAPAAAPERPASSSAATGAAPSAKATSAKAPGGVSRPKPSPAPAQAAPTVESPKPPPAVDDPNRAILGF
jgi:serine/threonine-protein kinase